MDRRCGHRDRISSLPDELLHVILTLVADARDVTRTAVLSRRWRHVWVHANSLRFRDGDRLNKGATIDGDRLNKGATGQLAGFVDWALARRGETAMESLMIWFSKDNSCATQEQVDEWLRYAGRHVLKSLDFQLDGQKQQQLAVELPAGHCRAASIRLSLSWKHTLRLRTPAAVATSYEALTELILFSPLFGDDEGTALGEFATSCCPSLRRIVISCPKALLHLVLRSKTLQELKVICGFDLRTLDVTAPKLRVVQLTLCFRRNPMGEDVISNKVARIVAPRLEEIDISHFSTAPCPDYDIHDLTSVRRLNNLQLDMHGKYCNDTDEMVGLWFLAKCPGVEHVDVKLEHHLVSDVADERDLVDLTKEQGNSVLFANVKSMNVSSLTAFPAPHLVASVASLLIRCSRHLRLLKLRINVDTKPLGTLDCFCTADLEDKWEIPRNIALEQLEEVIVTPFTGGDEEMQLLSLLFESSSSIKRMALCKAIKPIDIAYLTQEKTGKEIDGNTTLAIGQKLMNLPCADRGCWYFVEEVYIWIRHATQQ